MSSTSERRAPRLAASPKAPGVIRADELYTLEELQQRLQAGEWALRMARRGGLRMLKLGKRKYVKGSEVIRFLEQNPPSKSAENSAVED